MNVDTLERLPVERFTRPTPLERSVIERRGIGDTARVAMHHQKVLDDRPERARLDTEGWRAAAAGTTAFAPPDVPTFKSPPYTGAWERSDQPRMAGGFFPSPPWAGGGVEPPGANEVPEVRRDARAGLFPGNGNIFGNFFGWGETDPALNPVSPVDLTAYYHDMEYGAIQEKYGANPDPVKAWFEPFSRFDQPEFMYDLAMADLRFNENSWSFIGQGMDQGFYRGAPGLLATDILLASTAWLFHSGLAGVRLAFYSAQVVFGGIYKLFTGEMSLGDYLKSLLEGGAKLLSAAGYFVAGTVRGLWAFGTATMRGIARDPARGLTGAFIGGAIGSVFGPVGTVVGSIIGGAIGGSGGCFITTAACEVHGLPDDHQLLEELRRFRDGYMARDPAARALVELYYDVSPEIVAALRVRPDKERVYRHLMTQHIVPALDSIRRGRYRLALRQYRAMLIKAATMARLRQRVGTLPAIDRYRSLPDWDPATS
ncbi:hypothetical protein EOC93_28210 [Mesorhizobium sp. M6A.T.Ce.TU.002.03.1.1]|uniref:bacterial transcriptional activator domain-containing protein n=1 Tax=Mesorhizobium sp. M6A.T.Ce.TU.002.03.1.1 TaxID=2496782 RepID=UPI000FCC1569|nr:bacterial transcriptional activator domain-containing protein [Mesorhizobium sp. M6A.T.Ce.TU.002.03.1.1]RUU33680.1 hypothetical protein EOC93_28210 [Mesorhizobium sp. M6A.T.Ce.TU.002.03.1.1]